jgi:gliding motility-associated-like protein
MDGLNDAWFIQGIDVDASDFHVWVFNRWGDVVYESTSFEAPWVGNVQGGSHFAPNDTYFYRIETVSLATRERQLVTGTVTLTR